MLAITAFWWLVILFKPGPLPEWMHSAWPFRYSRTYLAVAGTICLAIAMLRVFG